MKATTKLSAALCGGTALLLALTGCGGDSTGKKRDTWSKGVCDQAATQFSRINEAGTVLSKVPGNADPKTVKAADSQNFQAVSAAFTSLAGIFNAADPAPGSDGPQYQKNAVAAFTALSGKYADLKKQADALDTSDRQKFADGLSSLSAGLNGTIAQGQQQLKTLNVGDMGKALAKQPGCQKISGPSAPSAPSSTASATASAS
ncbi:small secreted protein [Actinacidiphila acididurans]|uniref:Small secreted protein n=1 Tax=Actinacidiphila acididurans TaxID=2784346 RepID=A0ABS2TRM7_9ACTN|nr:small secreted protein [Actinacidiphila acididurans]MBM9505737.1 small secreted protein [Actinacidiphila acididurans]